MIYRLETESGGLVSQVDESRGAPSSITRLLSYLTTRPELDEICRHLVFTWPGADPIQQAAIGHLANDGSITFSGHFGYSDEVTRAYGVINVWDSLPSSLAIREQRIVVCSSASEIAERFPHIALAIPELAHVMAVPLISNLTPVGVFIVSGNHPLNGREQGEARMLELALALSLSLAGGWASSVPNRSDLQSPKTQSLTASRGSSRHDLVPDQLTERQSAVLLLLAEGLANRQIAFRVGFSESTIRQETMAIYAYLGVHTRADARKAAHLLGAAEAPKNAVF